MQQNHWRVSSLPMALLWGALLLFSCSKHDLRVQQLNDLQAQNQADTVFRSESLQRILVDYFNRHGSPNEKMLANYLLGRAYYDMGETPLALHYYHEAIDCADTTAADCDFKILSRVHGQTAWLLLVQGAPQNAIEEFDKSSECALHVGDTLMSLMCYSYKSSAYEKMNKLDSAVIIAEKASGHLLDYGDSGRAAMVFFPVIDIQIRRGDLKDAKERLFLYESVPNLFDEEGNIQSGKETYYYTKGLYYLAADSPDSANHQFRKLLRNAKRINDYECGYEGLSQVYERLGMKDSALYYSRLAYAYNDSTHLKKSTEYYEQTQAFYNYSRHQRYAEKKEKEAESMKAIVAISVLAFILALFIILYGMMTYRNKQKDAARRELELQEKLTTLQQTKTELEDMLAKEKAESLDIEEKRAKIELLECELRKYKTTKALNERIKAEEALMDSPIVRLFHQYGKDSKSLPTFNEWESLRKHMVSQMPAFMAFLMSSTKKLNNSEIEICMLIRLHFPLSYISYLTNRDSSVLSVMRKRILEKLFDTNLGGAKELDRRLLQFY